MRIPLIVVPRLKQYGEHFNDHQLEFAELLYKKFNIKYCVDCAELTECFLMNYNYVAPFSNEHLLEFRKNIKNIFDQQERSFYEISFY